MNQYTLSLIRVEHNGHSKNRHSKHIRHRVAELAVVTGTGSHGPISSSPVMAIIASTKAFC